MEEAPWDPTCDRNGGADCCGTSASCSVAADAAPTDNGSFPRSCSLTRVASSPNVFMGGRSLGSGEVARSTTASTYKHVVRGAARTEGMGKDLESGERSGDSEGAGAKKMGLLLVREGQPRYLSKVERTGDVDLLLVVHTVVHGVSATGAGFVFLCHSGFHCVISLKSADNILVLRSIALIAPRFPLTLANWGLERAVVPRFSYLLVRRTGAPDRRACGAGRV